MATSEIIPEHISTVQHLWYGHGHVPGKSDFEFSWKAIKAVVAADGRLSEPERLHLLGKMCAILTPPDVVEVVMGFDEHAETLAQLLARIDVPAEVRLGTGAWIVYEGLSVAIANGDLAAGELEAVGRAAAAMGVASETVDALTELCREEAAMRRRRIELLNSMIPMPLRFGQAS